MEPLLQPKETAGPGLGAQHSTRYLLTLLKTLLGRSNGISVASLKIPVSWVFLVVIFKLFVFAWPAVPPAVSYPDIIASICEDEAQAAVGQVSNPVTALQHQAMLQEHCRLWSWRKKKRVIFSNITFYSHFRYCFVSAPQQNWLQCRENNLPVTFSLFGDVFLVNVSALW